MTADPSFRTRPGITVATDKDNSGSVDLRNERGARIFVPSGSSITSLAFYESHDDSTYYECEDADGAAVTLTVEAGKSYPIPDSLFASGYLRFQGNAAGTVDVVSKG